MTLSCPRCGSTKYLSRAKQSLHYHDIPKSTLPTPQPVVLEIVRQRLQCIACNFSFFEPTVIALHEKRRMTMRLFRYIQNATGEVTDIAAQTGVDLGRIRKIRSGPKE